VRHGRMAPATKHTVASSTTFDSIQPQCLEVMYTRKLVRIRNYRPITANSADRQSGQTVVPTSKIYMSDMFVQKNS